MSKLCIQPIEYQSIKKIEDLEPINEGDIQLMNKIRNLIIEHGAEDRFGLCLLHRHFDVGPGEYAIEESYEKDRKSVVEIKKLDKEPLIDDPEYIPTTWKFTAENGTHVTLCVKRCQKVGGWSHNIVHVREGH